MSRGAGRRAISVWSKVRVLELTKEARGHLDACETELQTAAEVHELLEMVAVNFCDAIEEMCRPGASARADAQEAAAQEAIEDRGTMPADAIIAVRASLDDPGGLILGDVLRTIALCIAPRHDGAEGFFPRRENLEEARSILAEILDPIPAA